MAHAQLQEQRFKSITPVNFQTDKCSIHLFNVVNLSNSSLELDRSSEVGTKALRSSVEVSEPF